MSEKTSVDVVDKVDPVENDDPALSAAEIALEVEKLRAEVAKERGIRKKLQADSDTWKKDPKVEDTNEHFKELYQRQVDEMNKLKEKARSKDVEVAVRAQLSKVGILPDAVEAAVKLIDHKFITYDEDAGVDTFGVETAIKDLKSKMKFMFESRIDPSKNRTADSGKGADNKEMTRAEFVKLPLYERRDVALKYKITD